MDAISYTAARTNLAKTMEQVCEDHSPVIITRSKSQSVVMISLEDYEALQETAYLLRAPKNARRLLESVAELEQGGSKKRNFLNETHLLRERLGRLSVLAENQQKDPQPNQQADQRDQARTVRRCWQTRASQTQSRRVLVSANQRRTPNGLQSHG